MHDPRDTLESDLTPGIGGRSTRKHSSSSAAAVAPTPPCLGVDSLGLGSHSTGDERHHRARTSPEVQVQVDNTHFVNLQRVENSGTSSYETGHDSGSAQMHIDR